VIRHHLPLRLVVSVERAGKTYGLFHRRGGLARSEGEKRTAQTTKSRQAAACCVHAPPRSGICIVFFQSRQPGLDIGAAPVRLQLAPNSTHGKITVRDDKGKCVGLGETAAPLFDPKKKKCKEGKRAPSVTVLTKSEGTPGRPMPTIQSPEVQRKVKGRKNPDLANRASLPSAQGQQNDPAISRPGEMFID